MTLTQLQAASHRKELAFNTNENHSVRSHTHMKSGWGLNFVICGVLGVRSGEILLVQLTRSLARIWVSTYIFERIIAKIK